MKYHFKKQYSYYAVVCLLVLLFMNPLFSAVAADAGLVVVSTSGIAGSFVDVPINFVAGTTGVATMQFDVIIPSSLTFVAATAASAATLAGKDVIFNAITPTQIRVIVFGLNQNIINSGMLVAIRFNISAGTAGSQNISLTSITSSDLNGTAVVTTGTAGNVILPTPTPLPDTTAPSAPTGVSVI